jgi:hypothetical protein
LIRIKAHLPDGKQIPSVGIFDKDLFDTFLRVHLSLKLSKYGQILPQIVSFCILGTWDEKSGIRCFLNNKVKKTTKSRKTPQKRRPDGVKICTVMPSLIILELEELTHIALETI